MALVVQQPFPSRVQTSQQPQVTVLYTASGTPVQVVNDSDGIYHYYKAREAKILGTLQVTLGTMIIITQIVVTALKSDGYQGYVGFWAPLLFILAGAFGIRSSESKSRCTVVVTMVLSIISAVFFVGVFTQGIVGSLFVSDCVYTKSNFKFDEIGVDNRSPQMIKNCGNTVTPYARTCLAFYIMMTLLGLAEGIVAILAAAYCCHGCCCHSRPGTTLTPGMYPLPPASGMMPVATVGLPYQPNPSAYYPAPIAPVHTTLAPTNAPANYKEGSTPPPEYKEKI